MIGYKTSRHLEPNICRYDYDMTQSYANSCNIQRKLFAKAFKISTLFKKFQQHFSDFVNLKRKLITRIESGFRISADCLKIFFCFVAVIYNSTEDKFMVSVYHSLTTWHLIFYLWELMLSTETWVFSYQFMAGINIKYPYIYLRPIVMSHHASWNRRKILCLN